MSFFQKDAKKLEEQLSLLKAKNSVILLTAASTRRILGVLRMNTVNRITLV